MQLKGLNVKSNQLLRVIGLFVLTLLAYGVFVLLFMFKVELFANSTQLPFEANIKMVSFGSALLLSFWVFLLKRYYQFLTLLIINAIVTFIIIADLIYFRYFYDFITVPVILQAGQAADLGGSIYNLFRRADLYLVWDVLLSIPIAAYVIYRIYKGRKRRLEKHSENNNDLKLKWFQSLRRNWLSITLRLVTALLVFFIGLHYVVTPIQAYVDKWGKNLFINNWSNVSVYQQTGLFGFHAHDTYRFFDERVFNKRVITEEEINNIKVWFAAHDQKLAQEAPLFGAAKGKNVLIFQAEAFQNFVIGKEINGQEITPHLNELKKSSLYFDNFHHQVAQGRTSDAEFLTNVSLYPLSTGSVYIRFANNEFSSLPQILKEQGYTTAAFHPFERSFWNRYNMYDNIGFDHFYAQGDFAEGEKVGWTLGDEGLLQQTIDITKDGDHPYYSFVVGLSSHHPFTLPAKYHTLELGEYEGTDFGNYLQSLHYVDFAIGQAVEQLKAEGLWDETIFIVFGDHDSGTMKNDDAMAAFVGEEATDMTFDQMKYEVPLFIRLPEGEGAGEYHQVGGQIDLSPTILHLLGLPSTGYYFMGDNLLNDKEKFVTFRYHTFTDDQYFYSASIDQVFENGTCYERASGDKVDLSLCKEGYDKSVNLLRISDNIIFGDLLEQFKK